MISSLSGIIKKYQTQKSPNSIKHYIAQHSNVPLWVLINYMTLGQTVSFYKHMNINEQHKVAKIFSNLFNEYLECTAKIQIKDLISFLDNLLEVIT